MGVGTQFSYNYGVIHPSQIKKQVRRRLFQMYKGDLK